MEFSGGGGRKRSHPEEGCAQSGLKSQRRDNEQDPSIPTNDNSTTPETTQNDNSTTPETTQNGYSSSSPSASTHDTPVQHQNEGSSHSTLNNLQQLADASRSSVIVEDQGQQRRHEAQDGGRRAMRPSEAARKAAEEEDFVTTRIPGYIKKVDPKSSKGTQPINLISNYFPLNTRESFKLFHYHVDFDHHELSTFKKRKMFRDHASKLGSFSIFDGSALYMCQELPDDHTKLYSDLPEVGKVEISIKRVGEIGPFDPVNIQVYNTIIKQCMRELDLTQVGRNYYDSTIPVINARARLEIWPGYKTSLRQHERSLMLCVEMTNKVLRNDTVLDVIRKLRGDRAKVEQALLGSVVMTSYNKATYRIDEIAWEEDPQTRTFERRAKDQKRGQGVQVSLADYMKQRYQVALKDMKQPILYSRAKKPEVRKALARASEGSQWTSEERKVLRKQLIDELKIALIPELCQMTGLTDEQRADFNLMRDLNKTLQLNPNDRVNDINKFSKRLQDKNVQSRVLTPVGLTLENRLVDFSARKYNAATIEFGNGEWTLGSGPRDRYDWISKQQGSNATKSMELKSWAVIALDGKVESFVRLIMDKARKMGFNISSNYERELVPRKGNQKQAYLNAIEQVMIKYKTSLQMILIFLPKKEEDLYGAIKRRCYYDYGIPSQCVQDKHVNCKPGKEAAQSGVAVKLAVQMNAKLGGIPWEVKSLPKGVMVMGFNISQAGRALGSDTRATVGALVATMNDTFSRFHSVVVPMGDGEMLSMILGQKMAVILKAYTRNNGCLPKRIIFYRDGVGEGQLQNVVDTEIEQMRDVINSMYTATSQKAQFTFVVVNKRINTKFFVGDRNRWTNPGPGTCVDDVVTLPERYDFFLVSQTGTGQGTVSPASYNVIWNEEGDVPSLAPYQLQMLTYKLCHMYYNWTSTVSIPAVCQYANKLAVLQNIIKKQGVEGEAMEELADKLYYL